MPAYDYRCQQCEHVFEVRRSITAPIQAEPCPACQSTETARVYSAPYVAGSHQEKSCGSCSSQGSSGCAGCRH